MSMNFASMFEFTSEEQGLMAGPNSRLTEHGDLVDCYRNLNKPSMFSVRQREGLHKGLVSGYARAVILAAPVFVVSEKSRQRVLQPGGVRNVHAFVRGRFHSAFSSDLRPEVMQNLIRVSYSPYVSSRFFQLERTSAGEVVRSSIKPLGEQHYSFAVLNQQDVFLVPPRIFLLYLAGNRLML